MRTLAYQLGFAMLLIGICSIFVVLSLGVVMQPTGALVKSDVAYTCVREYRSCGWACRELTSVARRDCVAPCVFEYKKCRDVPRYVVSFIQGPQSYR
ncbi:hypothetical protein HY641_00455 [Candidatus Woesearchaeota archaeon]|nr:hypothetical protein [Candidatus Woesearchaeota archaeon]